MDDKHLELLTEIKKGLESHLSSPGHLYLEALMTREAKKAKLWDAIIEHSLASLVYSMLIAIVVSMGAYMKEHWKW